MQYKQAKAILISLAQEGSAKTRLAAIELLGKNLPRLGSYPSGSPENLLWALASDDSTPTAKRFKALCTLIITLAEKQKAKHGKPK